MSEAQYFYQAIGELWATLVIIDDSHKFLETEQARYRAFIPLKVEKKYQDKYQGQQVYWRVYPLSEEQGLAFQIVSLAEQPKKGHGQFTLQGDWLESGQLQIWRNPDTFSINKYNWRPKLLTVDWENAPPSDAAFWQLQAELVDGALKIVTAQGPFPHPPRLETLPELKLQQQHSQLALPRPQLKSEQATTTRSIEWEELTPVSGKLELTIKLNTLPQTKQVDGRYHFKVDCEGRVFQVSVKQKQWSKLETANTGSAQWIAAISGKLGAATADGFVLEEPSIQVFEHSPKSSQPKIEAEAGIATSQPPRVKNVAEAKAEVETPQAETNSSDKPSLLSELSASKAEPKPKKIGKFNVEVR